MDESRNVAQKTLVRLSMEKIENTFQEMLSEYRGVADVVRRFAEPTNEGNSSGDATVKEDVSVMKRAHFVGNLTHSFNIGESTLATCDSESKTRECGFFPLTGIHCKMHHILSCCPPP